MKVNELRIGNWIYDHVLGQYDQIEELKTEGAFFVKSMGYVRYDIIQPIFITPEILEKAGFVKDGIGYSKDWVYLWQDGNNIVFALAEMQEAIGTFLPVKFVHQLQNLYFALTGEELEINL